MKIYFLLCILVFFAVSQVSAYEYTADFSLSISEQYNDNIFLTGDRVDDFITFITPGVGLSLRSQGSDLRVGYSTSFYFYSSNTELNDTAHNFTANGSFTLSERLSLTLTDTYIKSSEIRDIRAIPDLGPISGRTERSLHTISGNIAYRLKENLSCSLGASYFGTDYKEPGFFDIKSYSGNIAITYRYSENITFLGTARYTKYDYKLGSDANAQDYSLGISYTLTPTLTAGATGGITLVEIEETGETDTGFFGGVDIAKTFTRGRVALSYRQSVISGIQTIEPIRDQTVTISISRDITNKLAASISASYSKFESIETYAVDTDVKSFNTGLTYTLFPWASLALSYSYLDQDDKRSDIGDYYNHIVFLNLALSYSKRL